MNKRKFIVAITSQIILLFFLWGIFSDTTQSVITQKISVENIDLIDSEETKDDTKTFDEVAFSSVDFFFVLFHEEISLFNMHRLAGNAPATAIPLYLRINVIIV